MYEVAKSFIQTFNKN